MNSNTLTQFRQRALAAGYTQKEVEAEIQRKMQEAAQYSLLESKVLDPTKVAASNPLLAARYVSEYGYNPDDNLSADEKKQRLKGTALSTDIDLLENLYTQTANRGPIAGRIATRIGSATGGQVAGEELLFNDTRNGLIAPLARVISGETGQLNEQDIRRAEGFLPRLSDDPKIAAKKLENVRFLISQATGLNPTQSASTPIPSQPARQATSQVRSNGEQPVIEPNQRRQSDRDAENRTKAVEGIAKFVGSLFPGITNFGVKAIQGEEKPKDLADLFLPVYAARRAKDIAPVVGEVGALAVPGQIPALAGGATTAARIGTGALRGATAGGFVSAGHAAGEGKDLISLGKEALSGAFVGGLLGGGLSAGSELVKGAARGITRTGEGLIQSQYTVPRTAAGALDPRQTIQDLSKYGVRNINTVPKIAAEVTGDTGLITKLTREAVVKSQPLDPSGLLQVADDISKDPAMPLGQDTKFYDFVKKGIQNLFTTKSTGAYSAANSQFLDPSKTFDFIQVLEKKAAGITRGRAPYAIQQQDIALSGAYRAMADELRTRLFTQGGGDKIALSFAQDPTVLNAARKISPQLAIDLSRITSVGELRSLAAPFVRASQMVNLTEQSRNMFPQSMMNTAVGIGKLFQNPLNLLAVPLSQPAPNAFMGGLLQKAGAAAQRGIPTDRLTQLLLSRGLQQQ